MTPPVARPATVRVATRTVAIVNLSPFHPIAFPMDEWERYLALRPDAAGKLIRYADIPYAEAHGTGVGANVTSPEVVDAYGQAILALLDEDPLLFDFELAKRLGISPQQALHARRKAQGRA